MMYNVFDDCEEYEELRDLVLHLLAGEEEEADPAELAERIQTAYEEDRLTTKQYDNLMSYLGELL